MSLEEVVKEVKINEKEVKNILNHFNKTPYFYYLSKEESMNRKDDRVEISVSSKPVDELDFTYIINSLKEKGYSLDILVDHSKKGTLISFSYKDGTFVLTYHKGFADILNKEVKKEIGEGKDRLKGETLQEDIKYITTIIEKYNKQ